MPNILPGFTKISDKTVVTPGDGELTETRTIIYQRTLTKADLQSRIDDTNTTITELQAKKTDLEDNQAKI